MQAEGEEKNAKGGAVAPKEAGSGMQVPTMVRVCGQCMHCCEICAKW
jgi:hypothetical protein